MPAIKAKRQCTWCGTTKHLAEFLFGKDGRLLYSYCKACEAALRQRKLTGSEPQKTCVQCGRSGYGYEFFKLNSGELSEWCVECLDARAVSIAPGTLVRIYAKDCAGCGVQFCIDKFFPRDVKRRNQSGGFRYRCLPCESDRGKRVYRKAADTRTVPQREGTKVCITCGAEKERAQFARHGGRKDGLRSDCRDCQRKTAARYRERRNKLLELAKSVLADRRASNR